ncbi:MAG: GNAT family N-acetyltransferase [Candidatus Curtissbacteria bacterium]
MVTVQKTTRKDIKKFSDEEWKIADMEHFGRPSNWKTKKFTYKAVEGGEVVGILMVEYEVGVLYIGDLLVSHKHRHKGIGKELMEKAEELAKELKAHKIYLETGKDWEAEKFYTALGFKPEGILKNHNMHADFVIYSKFI